jgi:phosphatidylethanolamine/phosphatidyl-N-methylethanolamine N-methyltransferase
MPSVEHAGTALFLKRWLRRPFAMGAVVPSGPLLARAMAETALACLNDGTGDRMGHVIELGAGTGEVTKALLATGIAPHRLALIERDPVLAGFLRQNFAPNGKEGPQIVEGDAAHLPGLLIANGVEKVATVVSSLPLLSLPAEVVNDIVQGIFEVLPPGAALVQFTYGPKPPVPQVLRDKLHLQSARGSRIWRNVPPAVVWTFRKPSSK